MPNIADEGGNYRQSIRPVRPEGRTNSNRQKAKQLLMDEKEVNEMNTRLSILNTFINNTHMEMLSPANAGDLYSSEVNELSSLQQNIEKNIAIYRIDKLMYSEEENIYEKLVSVYGAMNGFGGILGMIIQSDGKTVSLYLCSNTNGQKNTAKELLLGNLKGHFPGSEIAALNDRSIHQLLDSYSGTKNVQPSTVVRSLSMIPGRRVDEQQHDKAITSQGLEKFMDAMMGKRYTLLILSQKISSEAMDQCKDGFMQMYTSISPLAKEQVSYAVGESDSLNYSISNSISHSMSHSLSDSYGTSHTNSISNGRNKNSGTSSTLFDIGFSSGSGWSEGTGIADGTSRGKVSANTTSENDATSQSESNGRSTSQTRTLTMNRDNKTVISMMTKLDELIKRIEMNHVFGMWNSCCYVISDAATANMATSTLTSLFAGDSAIVPHAYYNDWDARNLGERNKVLNYLRNLYHPEINLTLYSLNEKKQKVEVEKQILTPGMMVTGKELPTLYDLPRKSVSGVVVDKMAEFSRNISTSWVEKVERPIMFGNVYHMGQIENQQLILDLDAFASHCFICGASGSGKSNTTYQLIENFIRNNIPFLVVEPAKGEYKVEFAGVKNIHIYTVDDSIHQKLQLNPFEFHPKVHIREHLDSLVSTISACWPLYGAMPGILKEAFEEVYIEHGWDLDNSIRLVERGSRFPTFKDLEKTLDRVIDESSYSNNTKGDYKGALLYRVSMLTRGFEGQIFSSSKGISDKVLFDQSSIIDLSNIGSEETKALIMGVIIIRLKEYRKSVNREINAKLKHVTVLEEAHNILKRCSTDTNMEAGNTTGASVKMLCECISEMRSFGEGFMVIDQSPTAVHENAIKNTAIKIVMRLPDKNDCEIMGTSLSLEDKQIRELSRLDIGVAAIYHTGWTSTMLGKMGQIWDKRYRVKNEEILDRRSLTLISGAMVQLMYELILEKRLIQAKTELKDLVDLLSDLSPSCHLPIGKQEELLTNAFNFLDDYEVLIRENNYKELTIYFYNFVIQFLRLDGALKVLPLKGVRKKIAFEDVDKKMSSVLKQSEKTAIVQWEKKIREIMSQYLVFPDVTYPERNYSWTKNFLEREHLHDIYRGLLSRYAHTFYFSHQSDSSIHLALNYLKEIKVL